MSFIVPPEIDEYAEAHSTPPGKHMRALADETRATLDAPQMLTGAVEGRFLQALVFATGATRVLEIGTYSGYAAISMAEALPPGGRVTTCEISERHAEFARRHIEAAGLSERIDVRVGPALDTIAALDGPFDLVFIDADKESYDAYYEAVLGKVSERGLIAIDNTLWSGRVLDGQGDGSDATAALRALNDKIAADERVIAVMLTVRDGITLIRRRRPS